MKAFQVDHRRVATIKPKQKRILNHPAATAHFGKIRWTSAPSWFPSYMAAL